jgi:hypothetical protein
MRANVKRYNIFLASLVVVITALIISVLFYQGYQSKLERYNQLNKKLSVESKRFTKLDDKSRMVAEYEERFNRYMPVDRYEKENRLYWLDALEKIRFKYKIPKLSYSIGVRKPYDYKDGVIKDKGLTVFVSDIKLTMSLMHEADLISVTNSLKEIKDSVHVISSCQLKRIGKGNSVKVSFSSPNIEAICNVRLYTFKVA